jgi:hypothetical protein
VERISESVQVKLGFSNKGMRENTSQGVGVERRGTGSYVDVENVPRAVRLGCVAGSA